MSAKIQKALEKIKRIEQAGKELNAIIPDILLGMAGSYSMKFKSALKSNELGLKPLKPITIRSKKSKGFSQPETPLFGAGDTKENTLYNSLRYKKESDTVRVFVSGKRHWDAGITMNELFNIMENGSIVSRNGKMHRVPPRPAIRNSRRKFEKETRLMLPASELKRMVRAYINGADKKEFLNVARKFKGEFTKSGIKPE